MTRAFRPDEVVVVGGGISGVACARRLHESGVAVRLVERSHRLGGRMAVRTENVAGRPHAVDIGASYFTVSDERFARVVQGWRDAGLAHEWTDTFLIATPDGRVGTTSGPVRWSARHGLRSLVEHLADGIQVGLECEVEAVTADGDRSAVNGEPVAAVVLALPAPQAAVVLPAPLVRELDLQGHAWTPGLCIWAAWAQPWWPAFDGVFVDQSKVLAWVADDGRRRGDGAPLLVAHTTTRFAEARLEDVATSVGPVLRELPAVLGAGAVPEPLWVRAHRWPLAAPRHTRPEPFRLTRGLVGVCGDGWGPRSRIEQAWLSGHLLAGELLTRLGTAD